MKIHLDSRGYYKYAQTLRCRAGGRVILIRPGRVPAALAAGEVEPRAVARAEEEVPGAVELAAREYGFARV